jgi:hypothetical protein
LRARHSLLPKLEIQPNTETSSTTLIISSINSRQIQKIICIDMLN